MVRRVTELEGGFEGGFVRSLDTDWLQDSRAAAAAGEGALGHSSRQLDTDGAPKRATSPATSTPPLSLKKNPTQNSFLFCSLDFEGMQTLLK